MLDEGINPATGCRERKNVAASSERGREERRGGEGGGSSKLMEIRIGPGSISGVFITRSFRPVQGENETDAP